MLGRPHCIGLDFGDRFADRQNYLGWSAVWTGAEP